MQVDADISTTKRMNGNSMIIKKDIYYTIEMYDTFPTYAYTLYNDVGDVVVFDFANVLPTIEYVTSKLLSIRTGHSSGFILYTYYDISRESISISYENPIAIDSDRNLVAYLYFDINKNPILIIRDIFNKTNYYKEFTLDIASIYPGIVEYVEFLPNNELKITYYKGKDLVKTTEIFLLQSNNEKL
jgi:hypothetical protein